MTETWGYVCPICLGWWTAYLNKGETLCCGCGVKKTSAIFLYRKTYGNHFLAKAGVACEIIEMTWKQDKLNLRLAGDLDGLQLFTEVQKSLGEKSHTFLAKYPAFTHFCFSLAYHSASHHEIWWVRCQRCRNYRGKKQCTCGHNWLSTSCTDFDVKDEIAIQMQLDLNEIELINR